MVKLIISKKFSDYYTLFETILFLLVCYLCYQWGYSDGMMHFIGESALEFCKNLVFK